MENDKINILLNEKNVAEIIESDKTTSGFAAWIELKEGKKPWGKKKSPLKKE